MNTEKNRLTRSNVRDLVLLFAFASSLIFHHSVTTVTVGFSLLAVGCFLHVVAKGVLIRNVVLCDRGIYSIIRHPYYLSNYVVDLSFCILSGNPYLMAAYPFLFFWSYGPTLRKEEKFLASKYGDSFQNDSFNIPQVFPDRASLQNWRALFQGFSIRRVSLKERARIMRFCSSSFAIMLVHTLNVNNLQHLLSPTRTDYHAFLFLLLTTVFLCVSVTFTLFDRNHRNESEDSCFPA